MPTDENRKLAERAAIQLDGALGFRGNQGVARHGVISTAIDAIASTYSSVFEELERLRMAVMNRNADLGQLSNELQIYKVNAAHQTQRADRAEATVERVRALVPKVGIVPPYVPMDKLRIALDPKDDNDG